MKKTILYTLIMFSIFSCFRKKTPRINVETELERMFPGQFQVLNSNLKMLDVMAQYKGEKQAVIGDKADPEVQFLLDWHKGESVGFDSATVQAAHERSKAEISAARALYKLLEDKGLERFSVGVMEQTAYIKVFTEPVLAIREQTLIKVKSALDARQEQPQTSIFIEMMEPAAFQTELQQVIPRAHWKNAMAWDRENKIMSLDFEWSKSMKIPETMRHWELSPDSKRISQYREAAYKEALKWAEKNLPQPCFMPSNRPVGYESLKIDGPAIRYGFPYYDQKLPEESSYENPEPTGYVSGTYSFDKQVFSGIRRQAEF